MDSWIYEGLSPMRVLKLLAAWLIGLAAMTLFWFELFLLLARWHE